MKRIVSFLLGCILALTPFVFSSAETAGEKNALAAANLYLSTVPYSYQGLIDQLEFDGYTSSEAKYGADNCKADWKELAKLDALNYLGTMPMSEKKLREQLQFDGFLDDEIDYAIETAYNGNESEVTRSNNEDVAFVDENGLTFGMSSKEVINVLGEGSGLLNNDFGTNYKTLSYVYHKASAYSDAILILFFDNDQLMTECFAFEETSTNRTNNRYSQLLKDLKNKYGTPVSNGDAEVLQKFYELYSGKEMELETAELMINYGMSEVNSWLINPEISIHLFNTIASEQVALTVLQYVPINVSTDKGKEASVQDVGEVKTLIDLFPGIKKGMSVEEVFALYGKENFTAHQYNSAKSSYYVIQREYRDISVDVDFHFENGALESIRCDKYPVEKINEIIKVYTDEYGSSFRTTLDGLILWQALGTKVEDKNGDYYVWCPKGYMITVDQKFGSIEHEFSK